MNRETTFSPCRKYRYTLWRDWSKQLRQPGMFFTEDPHLDYHLGTKDTFALWVLLNPSTADATKDDPTIRRVIDFSKRWGFGACCVVNIFAFRATDPAEMKQQKEPVGKDNDLTILNLAKEAGMIIAGWGNHGTHQKRSAYVSQFLVPQQMKCLGTTDTNQPFHPLYIPADKQPINYP